MKEQEQGECSTRLCGSIPIVPPLSPHSIAPRLAHQSVMRTSHHSGFQAATIHISHSYKVLEASEGNG